MAEATVVERTDAATPNSAPPATDPPMAKGVRFRWTRSIPMTLALLLVAGVWVAGCVWSFEEQTAFAESKDFHLPWLLPLVIDGLAIAMAAVAFAASLDARPAVFARGGIAVAVVLSAASNAAWAWERSTGDTGTIALASVVPVLANLAFEVLLSEIRRQVMRRRGIPAPVKIPLPRLTQMALSPWKTFAQWRRLVLKVTDLEAMFAAAAIAAQASPDPAPQTPARKSTRPLKRTPAPRQTRSGAVKQTPKGRTPGQTPADQTPLTQPDPPEGVRSGGDEPDLARLRAAYPDQTPSINEVQRLLGGGRARAIRLRNLVEQTPAASYVSADKVNGREPQFAAAGT